MSCCEERTVEVNGRPHPIPPKPLALAVLSAALADAAVSRSA